MPYPAGANTTLYNIVQGVPMGSLRGWLVEEDLYLRTSISGAIIVLQLLATSYVVTITALFPVTHSHSY